MDSDVLTVLVFGLLLQPVAGALAIGVLATARKRRAHAELLRTGTRGTATVVDNRITRHHNTEGLTTRTFNPVVVLDGQDDAQPVTLGCEARKAYPVGSKVDVVYDPTDPSTVRALNPPSPVFYVVAVVAGAALALFVGMVLIVTFG